MKKYLSIPLSLSLLILSCTSVFGAVHRFDDNDYATMDTWYTINPHPAYMEAHVETIEGTTTVGGEFYQNDQTYLGAQLGHSSIMNDFKLKASYLTNLGLFAGAYLDYNKEENNDSTIKWTIWPGYRYSFSHGYLAFSLDIGKNEASDEVALQDFDLDGLYLFHNGKINGEILIPTEGETSFIFQGRMKPLSDIVFGLDLYSNNNVDLALGIGATWIPVSDLILDGMVATDNAYALSCMYMIKQFGLGVEANSDDYIYLKAKYLISRDNKLALRVGVSTVDAPTKLTLAYENYL